MYGSAIGTLSVVLKTASMGDVVIWSQTYGLGDVWLPASLDIIVDETFQVCFLYKGLKTISLTVQKCLIKLLHKIELSTATCKT